MINLQFSGMSVIEHLSIFVQRHDFADLLDKHFPDLLNGISLSKYDSQLVKEKKTEITIT